MEWFQGTATEAVQQVQKTNSILLALLIDESEESVQISDAFTNEEVIASIKSRGFTALRMNAGSLEAKNFAQIYPVPSYPTLYFISFQGSVLGSLTGLQTASTLNEMIAQVGQAGNITVRTPLPSVNSTIDPPAQPEVVGQQGEEEGVGERQPCDQEGERELTLKEKADRLRESLRIKREQNMAEAQEEQRQKELERRKQGQLIGQQKLNRAYQERLKMAEERKREKLADQALKNRIKAQIAEDRKNVLAKNAPPSAVTETQSSSTSALPVSTPSTITSGSTCNILYRLPEGDTLRHQYQATTTLGGAVKHLLTEVSTLTPKVRLLTGFPPREFTSDQLEMTLGQLGLVPSATIIVKPSKANIVQRFNTEGTYHWLLEIIMAAFAMLPLALNPLYYLGVYTPPQNTQSTQHDYTDRHGNESPSSSNRETGQMRGGSRGSNVNLVRRNVHSLRHNSDDPDSDNTETWNGNSTNQQ